MTNILLEKGDEALYILVRLGELVRQCNHATNRRPILGAAFAPGQYSMCSLVVPDKGLHGVAYMVVEETSHAALSIADSKAEALRFAREVLSEDGQPTLRTLRQEMAKVIARQTEERDAWRAQVTERMKRSDEAKRVPKRRREIFEASGGACHYCKAVLSLDGKWHIEHKMPRALMGGNEPSNLVAACVSCNMKKRDRTDVEFMASREAAA